MVVARRGTEERSIHGEDIFIDSRKRFANSLAAPPGTTVHNVSVPITASASRPYAPPSSPACPPIAPPVHSTSERESTVANEERGMVSLEDRNAHADRSTRTKGALTWELPFPTTT